jgi:flavin-dependent dehydrogenase
VVAGGGPAGSATALDLSRRGFRVALIEQSAYENFRVGETLPPEIRKLLTEMGVWERFLASAHVESHGIRSAWETPTARHHDFLYNPYGCGWHVERAGFDAMLAGAAADAGAELILSARITALDKDANGQWIVEIVSGGKKQTLGGRLLVDATGRKGSIARTLGCGVQAVDRLVGAVTVLPRSGAEQWTLIEAVENGWWYTAPLPGDRTVFAYMTDSDLLKDSSWGEFLKQAPLTSERASAIEELPQIHIVSAASVVRQPVTGPNWIATGDAALAFDPLSGLGIYKTIESGLRSSAAIVRCFEGDSSGMVEYENWTVEGFRSYLSMRQQFYGSVQRWPESPFWQRRALLKTPPTQAKSIGDGLHLADEKESGTERRR